MPDIKVTESGEILVKCPSCRGYRTYSNIRHARMAVKRKKECVACAVHNRRHLIMKDGISKTEIDRIARNAATRGFSWGITDEDILDAWRRQEGKCALSGTPMQKHPRTWSVDRIDNSCGYTPGNIQLVLKNINMMRGALSVEDFLAYCDQVSANRSNT